MNYQQIDSPAAWTQNSLANCSDFYYYLTTQERAEIDNALSFSAKTAPETLTKADFPLPKLGPVITNEFTHQLEQGKGVLLIKGLATKGYSEQDLAKIFFCFGLYLGTMVKQNRQGELIFRVEVPPDTTPKNTRGSNTNAKLVIHNDPSDVSGLLCVHPAEIGGENQIVSSIAIHNKILATHPECLPTLYQPFCYIRSSVSSIRQESLFLRPVFAIEQGFFVCNIVKPAIYKAQQRLIIPRLTAAQTTALDVFEAIASSPALSYQLKLQAGDMLFMNNYTVLHSRNAYEGHSRLLFRIWLSPKNNRPLPQCYELIVGDCRAGAVRGGIQL